MHTGRAVPTHVSMWRVCIGMEKFTHANTGPPQHSSGRVSPKGPTAFNQLGHEAPQMGLSAGWDRRKRVGGGGAAGHLVTVNIFAPPTPYRVTLLGERGWTAGAALALPCSARAFSSVALANIFHHRTADWGCFEKSTV